MKKQIFTLSIVLVSFTLTTVAQVINVPADQTTIQAAIDAATEGDTVLVAEGTYYENINYNGKAITVASQLILDGDTSHISKTVIDGSQPSHVDSACVVRMMGNNDTTSVLCGFTITGGKGIKYNSQGTFVRAGGGIVVMQGAKIIHNIIYGNELTSDNQLAVGGGIAAKSVSSAVVIRNNIIRDNHVQTSGAHAEGGGLGISSGSNHKYIIENNIIQNNTTHCTTNNPSYGAGVLYVVSDPKNCILIIKGNNITGNVSTGSLSRGGGFYFELLGFASPQNDLIPYVEMSNNIIANNSAQSQGGGLWFDEDNNYYHSKDPMPLIINNTITGNSAPLGREIYNSGLKILLMNNIVWNDYTPLSVTKNGSYKAWYNDIKGGYTGEGNIDADPMLDPETFALLEGSPCIGKGAYSVNVDNAWYPSPDFDYFDLPRPNAVDHWTDIGAIESEFTRAGDPTLIKVPEEVATIQAAIDAADEGDTVLVAEGTYFENIDYKGKAIIVASEFILDRDTSHISKTVIDGSQPAHPDSASVVRFMADQDTTSVLCGFTITGGKGLRVYSVDHYVIAGGGIAIFQGAKIENNIIHGNEVISDNLLAVGGGIVAKSDGKDVVIRHNTIRDNFCSTGRQAQGGGINLAGENNKFIIENNTIENNKIQCTTSNTNDYLSAGAGLLYVSSDPKNCSLIIRGNKITGNTTTGRLSWGGGIFLQFLGFTSPQNDSIPFFDISNNIIANNSAGNQGGGLWLRDNNSYYRTKDPMPLIINNTITGNYAPTGREIFNRGLKILLMNNIIWNDYTPLYATDNGSYEAYYNDIKGGYSGEENINVDPMIDPETFALLEGSKCIGAGVDSVEIESIWYKSPAYDFNGNPRPNPKDEFVDMGAIESDFPTALTEGLQNTGKYLSIFPNPTKDVVTIKMKKPGKYSVAIYNISGQEVYNRVVDQSECQLDLSAFKKGIYFLTIRSDEFVWTEKVIKR